MSQGGKPHSFAIACVNHFIDIDAKTNRDVTDYLQLLLRKAGHDLHTSAEREVVRTIKEKSCYVATNPAKEEKDMQGRTEEFKLPDGTAIQVRSHPFCWGGSEVGYLYICEMHSSAQNDSVHLKFCSTQN